MEDKLLRVAISELVTTEYLLIMHRFVLRILWVRTVHRPRLEWQPKTRSRCLETGSLHLLTFIATPNRISHIKL
jgi:hypothetical protein